MSVTKITVNRSAVEYAEKILEMCKSGEATSILCIVQRDNGDYQFMGSTTKKRTEMAAILLEAAMERLGFKAESITADEV